MSATDKAEMQEKEDKLVIEEGQDGSLTVSGLPDEVPEGDDKEVVEAKAPASEGEQSGDSPEEPQAEAERGRVVPVRVKRIRRRVEIVCD